MTKSVIAIGIGPVQEFIAAARRTADLYAGSDLLVQVVGAAAATFDDAERIFPSQPASGGANKILAVVEDDPAVRAGRAREAAREALNAAWQETRAELRPGVANLIDWKRADRQIDQFLEFYAAWTRYARSYDQARARAERLLAARKTLRDFPPSLEDDGYPRSPLDVAQASVVSERGRLRVRDGLVAQYPLWLKKTEVLDAVSVLKRVRGVTGKIGGAGQATLSTRALAQRSQDPTHTDPKPSADRDPEGEEFVPDYPYYAIVVADGDRMGQLLSRPATEGEDLESEHRAIAQDLDWFAQSVPSLTQDHHGQLVYCGGDDVLALLPVTEVIKFADALRTSFEGALAGKVTLSAGVAIVHYLEPLSVGLRRGREAERLAKVDRDSLAVSVHTRGGAPVSMAQRWSEHPLSTWLELSRQGVIGRGVPYEFRRLAQEWPDGLDPAALRAEMVRILRRKADEAGQRQPRPDAVHPAETALGRIETADDVEELVDCLLIARFLTGRDLSANTRKVDQ